MVTLHFVLRIAKPMTAPELLDEFIRQYFGADGEAEVAAKRGLLEPFASGTTDKMVSDGRVNVNFTTFAAPGEASLTPAERRALDAEVDARVRKRSVSDLGAPGATAPDTGSLRAGVRRGVLAERMQRTRLDALPPDVKRTLFAGGVASDVLAPEDYGAALEAAEALSALPPDAREDYRQRVTSATASFGALARSVRSYIEERAARKRQEAGLDEAAQPLARANRAYALYNARTAAASSAGSGAASRRGGTGGVEDPSALADPPSLTATDAALEAELEREGLGSIAEFETALEEYRLAFRIQAVNFAADALQRYEHMLFEERKRLSEPGTSAAIVHAIAGTQAAALYRAHHDHSGAATGLRMGLSLDERHGTAADRADIAKEEAAADTAHDQAEAAVIRGAGSHPLVAERGVDREKLAGLDASGVQNYLYELVHERGRQIRTAREELANDPNHVFELPALIQAVKQLRIGRGDSIYASIVDNYTPPVKLTPIALAVLQVALLAAIPGGGWLAAGAIAANTVVGAIGAYDAVRTYGSQQAAYNLGFLDEEPSLFWVGVAVVSTGLDAGLAWKACGPAVAALRPSLLTFARDGQVAPLLAKIRAAEGLDATFRRALERELELAGSARRQWTLGHVQLVSGLMGADTAAGVDAGGFVNLYRAALDRFRRRGQTIAKLGADAAWMKVVEDVTRMSGAERDELAVALAEVKRLVLSAPPGMDEVTLGQFVDRWALSRGQAQQQALVLDDLRAWKPAASTPVRLAPRVHANVERVLDDPVAAAGYARLKAAFAESPAELDSVINEIPRLNMRRFLRIVADPSENLALAPTRAHLTVLARSEARLAVAEEAGIAASKRCTDARAAEEAVRIANKEKAILDLRELNRQLGDIFHAKWEADLAERANPKLRALNAEARPVLEKQRVDRIPLVDDALARLARYGSAAKLPVVSPRMRDIMYDLAATNPSLVITREGKTLGEKSIEHLITRSQMREWGLDRLSRIDRDFMLDYRRNLRVMEHGLNSTRQATPYARWWVGRILLGEKRWAELVADEALLGPEIKREIERRLLHPAPSP